MLTVLSTLLPVFGIIVLGMVIERCRLMPAGTAGCLNQFVYWIGLPALLFNQMARVEPARLFDAYVGGVTLGMVGGYALAYLALSGFLLRRRPETTVKTMLASFPNSAFMGLPIVMLLLPGNQPAAVAASLAAVMNTLVLIAADTSLAMRGGCAKTRWQSLLNMGSTLARNPMLVASAAGAVVACTGLPLGPLVTMSGLLGATASPCALFCLGMILAVQMLSAKRVRKGWFVAQLPIHALKLVLLPGLSWACLTLLGVSGNTLAVGSLIAAMPTGIAAYVVAEKFQLYAEEASICILVDTGLSLITVPVMVLVMQGQGLLM